MISVVSENIGSHLRRIYEMPNEEIKTWAPATPYVKIGDQLYKGSPGEFHYTLFQRLMFDEGMDAETLKNGEWGYLSYKGVDMPGSQMFPREHSGSHLKESANPLPFHKYVWADGKVAVGPRATDSNVTPWHTHLMTGLGYDYNLDSYHMPDEYSLGFYYPHDDSVYEVDCTANRPDNYSIVKQIHEHLYGDRAASYFLDTL